MSLANSIRPFVVSEWCDAGFYRDLFEWADAIRRSLPPYELTGAQEALARTAYEDMLTAYEFFRTKSSQVRVATLMARDHALAIRSHAHVHLSDAAITKLTKEAWDLSVSLGAANAETGGIHVALLLDRADEASAVLASELRLQALNVVRAALKSEPAEGELIFFMARLRLAGVDIAIDDLTKRVETALKGSPTEIQVAFLKHAQAIVTPDKSKRIALLRDAADGYSTYSMKNDYFFFRVRPAFLRRRDAAPAYAHYTVSFLI